MYLMRAVPVSPTEISMQYEVYRHESCSEKEFKEMDEFMKQIENEDRVICTRAQKNLNAGIYDAGPLHIQREKGVRYFKSLVKEAVMSHYEEEQRRGHKILPARRQTDNEETKNERSFCENLCTERLSPHLAW
jgi:hypothetical protein